MLMLITLIAHFLQDRALIRNTSRALACTYDGETSCATRVITATFPQFVSY